MNIKYISILLFISLLFIGQAFADIPTISFIDPTLANASTNNTGSVSINTSVTNATNATALLNWNNSLVGWWRMNEAAGGTLVQDFSGYGNNGTWYGNTTSNVTAGQFGNALAFDGVDDYVNAGNNASLNFVSQDFTITMWIEPATIIPAAQTLFIRGLYQTDGYNFEMRTNRIWMRTEQAGAEQNTFTTNSIIANQWQHIVMVRNGSSVTLYRNNINITSSAATHINPLTSTRDALIGIYGYTSSPFNGSIDEVRIYNRALSADEIAMQYNSSKYYPYASNVSASISGGEQSVSLYRYENTTLAAPFDSQILGAGQYWYIANASATQNYTGIEGLLPFEVSQNATNPISLWMMNNSNNLLNQNISGTYPMVSNTTAFLNYIQSGTLNLYYNDLLNNTLNFTNMTLSAGIFKVTANTTGNTNYTANSTTFWININKAATSIQLWLDGIQSGKNFIVNSIGNFTAQLNISRNITLFSNYSGFTLVNGNTTIYNTILLNNLGNNYNVTANWTGDANYTGTQTDYIFNVVPIVEAPGGQGGAGSGYTPPAPLNINDTNVTSPVNITFGYNYTGFTVTPLQSTINVISGDISYGKILIANNRNNILYYSVYIQSNDVSGNWTQFYYNIIDNNNMIIGSNYFTQANLLQLKPMGLIDSAIYYDYMISVPQNITGKYNTSIVFVNNYNNQMITAMITINVVSKSPLNVGNPFNVGIDTILYMILISIIIMFILYKIWYH